MDQQTVIADIEQQAWQLGISISALCRRANVHPTTFSRWKRSPRNPDPLGATLHSIGKLYDALESFRRESTRGVRRRKAVAA